MRKHHRSGGRSSFPRSWRPSPRARPTPPRSAGVEKYLRDDEKALLAAILTHPDVSAQFDAEAPLALSDPKNLAPFLGVWRGKVEAFAEADGARPTPDLEGRYANYAQLMTPEQRAYMVRRLPTMKEDDRNSLIGYLGSVNDALAKNGQLTWYTKKVVAGIMDHYRQDLNTYVATPIAQTARRDAAASAAAFAAIRKADDDAASPPPGRRRSRADGRSSRRSPVGHARRRSRSRSRSPRRRRGPLAPATAARVPPTDAAGTVVTTGPTGGALAQARQAADRAGGAGGQVFDGGAGARPASAAARRSRLPRAAAPAPADAHEPRRRARRPDRGSCPRSRRPLPAEASFMDAIKKMRTKPAQEPFLKRIAPVAGGVLGGILGGLIGFMLGGPVGAIIGAGLGIVAGAYGAKIAVKHLVQ